MSSTAALFVASTIWLQIFITYGEPTQYLDFRKILALAQQQASENNLNEKVNSYGSAREEYNTQNELSSSEILDLIKKSIKTHGLEFNNAYDKKLSSSYANRYYLKPQVETDDGYDGHEEFNEDKLDNDYKRYKTIVPHKHNLHTVEAQSHEQQKDSRFNEIALEELLSTNVLDKNYQSKPRVKVIPHNLIDSHNFNEERSLDNNNVDGYSKIFVILNPKAVTKSKNQDELSNLLVKILSLAGASPGKDHAKWIKDRRYKGFYVKPGLLSRRARRESREMDDGRDSIEEDYKPKRPRNDRGGGGGKGAGGRTAIPYARNRGDIYERDN